MLAGIVNKDGIGDAQSFQIGSEGNKAVGLIVVSNNCSRIFHQLSQQTRLTPRGGTQVQYHISRLGAEGKSSQNRRECLRVQMAQGELQKVTRLAQVLGAENHGQGLFLHPVLRFGGL